VGEHARLLRLLGQVVRVGAEGEGCVEMEKIGRGWVGHPPQVRGGGPPPGYFLG
jgi:hypothetical protein